MKRYLLLFFTLFCVNAIIKATQPESIFERYTAMDGLPHNAITDIHQDEKGFLWVSTWYGLSRFDGYTFKNYNSIPGDNSPIKHNHFLSIKEDVFGYLWIAAYDSRLYRFDRSSEKFVDVLSLVPEFKDKICAIKSYVNGINGDTWLSVQGEGLVCIKNAHQKDVSKISTVVFSGTKSVGRNIRTMFEFGKGILWVASEIGLSIISSDGNGNYKSDVVSPQTQVDGMTDAGEIVFYIAGNRFVSVNTMTMEQHVSTISDKDGFTSIAKSGDNRIVYAGTASSGIYIYDPHKKELTHGGQFNNRIRSIVPDSQGLLWLTTDESGITRYNPKDRSYKSFSQTPNAASYHTDGKTKILERGSVVWIKMNDIGFGYYDRAEDNIKPFYNAKSDPSARFTNAVSCFHVSLNNDVLWMATSKLGLEEVTMIKPKADIFGDDGQNADFANEAEISSLIVDSDRQIWVGRKGRGLFCYDNNKKLIKEYRKTPDGESLELVCAMHRDSKGNIWIGTRGNGLFKLQKQGNDYRFTRYKNSSSDKTSISDNNVYSIAEDNKGRIWLATFSGINMIEQQGDKAVFINPENGFAKYPADADHVRIIIGNNSGTMAAATIDGLLLFDSSEKPEQMTFQLVQKIPGDPRSLGSNDIVDMIKDYRGRVWISTIGGGLNLMREGKTLDKTQFDVYDTKHGLNSNNVYAATEDRNGNIWVSTESGISRFEPSTQTFSNYSRYDGIQGEGFTEKTGATDSRGNVLFGGRNCIYSINPDNIVADKQTYQLTITGFEIKNSEAEIGDKAPLRTAIFNAKEIVLPYHYSVFNISFVSLNFKMQPRMNYMFMLEGFDKDWNIVGKGRNAAYSNVPAGEYMFKVRCYSEDNPSHSDVTMLRIIIEPPLWQTTWAYLFYVIVGCILLWFIINSWYTSFSLRNRMRFEQQINDMKVGFFTNISHELRNPLTLILGGIDNMRKNEILTEEGKKSLRLVQRNARRMLTMISQLIDFRNLNRQNANINLQDHDIVSIVRDVADDFKDIAADHNIEFKLHIPDTPLMVWVDTALIENVIHSLLVAAFRYTGEDGDIDITVQRKGGFFSVEVKDNGIGIPKDQLVMIFESFDGLISAWSVRKSTGIALAIAKQIIKLHNGEMTVISTPVKGTTITVDIPIWHFPVSVGDTSKRQFTDARDEGNIIDAFIGSVYETMVVNSRKTEGIVSMMRKQAPTDLPEDTGTVMIVEDNEDLRLFLHNILVDNYHVVEAIDGADAINKLETVNPDIIVTDIVMPNVDGIELINHVRNDSGADYIPIIVISARSIVDDRIADKYNGADDYITKPFNADQLKASINNLLKRRKLFVKKRINLVEDDALAGMIDMPPSDLMISDRDEGFIHGVMEWIDTNIDNPNLTISQLATSMGLGRTKMYNKLKSMTGKSPKELINDYRINKAMLLMGTGQYSVSEIAYKMGFSDPGYFSKCFKEHYGMSPMEFMKNIHQ